MKCEDTFDGRATPKPTSSAKPLPRTVRLILRARREREAIFGDQLFADPAWDILLEAYASSLSEQRLSIGALCEAAAVPSTTALRWLTKLEQDGWLRRRADPLDARRWWVELTERGVSAMERLAAKTPIALPV